MGLYSASKHAIEGMSETLDHEVRNFGVRVVLVEPSYTKTNLDLNAPKAANPIQAYEPIATSCRKPSCKASRKRRGPTPSRRPSWRPRSVDGRCAAPPRARPRC